MRQTTQDHLGFVEGSPEYQAVFQETLEKRQFEYSAFDYWHALWVLAKLARQYRIPDSDINLGYSQPDASMMIVEFLHADLGHGVQRFLLLLASLSLCREVFAWKNRGCLFFSIQDFCCSSRRDRPYYYTPTSH